jgi:predicted PurR-regulated permease PerM
LGDIYVILFIGIFFTFRRRSIQTVSFNWCPRKGRQKAGEMLSKINDDLKKWLKGKLFAMLVVFILTSVGLLAIGLPLWLGQRFGNPCFG